MSEVQQTERPGLELEELLVQEGAVTEDQVRRARRIAGRMERARPVGDVLVELGQLSRSELDRIVRLHRSRLGLVEILFEEGHLTEEQLATFRQLVEENPGRPERELLVNHELVTEEQFLQALSIKHGIPFVEPEISLIDKSLLQKTSIPYLRRLHVLPLRVIDGALHTILADPLNSQLLHDLEGIFGCRVAPCCAPSDKILEVLGTLDHMREGADADGESGKVQYREIQDPDDSGEGEGAVRIVDYLLFRSIELGASDLHIEPLESKVRVRVRIDGVLRKLTDLPVEFAQRMAARIKVLAGADIAERRLHQDGRIFIRVDNREIDIRLSTYASMFGETLVMRILDSGRGLAPLNALGFQPRVLNLLMEVILRTSSGLILVTGPTGSGKTTTLYSFVDYCSSDEEKVITAEDPVEYVIEGITQCSVNEKTGPTFADSLRAIVRQDPDTIVVGEIRDHTTANLAVQSALTGHKVLSTFHTEDSVGAVLRLLEMGIEPFLIASTLCCVLAQRLVRKLCPHCQKPDDVSARDLRFLGLSREEIRGVPTLVGAGCAKCDNSGFSGRAGVHELLWPDDDFKDAILRRASTLELRALARKLPAFLTLQEDAVLKFVEGRTTLSEIVENVPRDPNARSLNTLREVGSGRRHS